MLCVLQIKNIQLALGPHDDGVVGSAYSTPTTQIVGQLGQLTLFDNPTKAAPIITATTLLA